MSQLPRKTIPLGVRLDATLLHFMGVDALSIDWDHDPPLALREFDPETGIYTPHEHDPRHITPRLRADHKRKTFGSPATTAGSDIHAIAKVKRILKNRWKAPRPKPKFKTKIPSRPFPKRHKK